MQGGQYGGLPVPDGPVLRPRRPARPGGRGWCSGCGSGRCSRWRPGGRYACWTRCLRGGAGVAHVVARPARAGQPVRGGVREPHDGDPAGLRRCCPGCCSRSTAALRAPRAGAGPPLFAPAGHRIGAGVNAAVTGLLLLGPRCCWPTSAVYAGVPWRARARFAVARRRARAARASLWWLVPAWVQAVLRDRLPAASPSRRARSGPPRALSESLRLMGYWISYIGVGYSGRVAPYFDDARGAAVLAGRGGGDAAACPAWRSRASRGRGAGATRRSSWCWCCWALLVMVAGFPEGTPLRRGAHLRVQPLPGRCSALRTTYKAGPLVALGLACLAGVAAARLARGCAATAGRARPRRGRRRVRCCSRWRRGRS